MPGTALEEVIKILCDTLELEGPKARLTAQSQLLGVMPELDSMSVINVIVELEEHFDVFFQDDEVTADTFESVATLTALVTGKLQANA